MMILEFWLRLCPFAVCVLASLMTMNTALTADSVGCGGFLVVLRTNTGGLMSSARNVFIIYFD